MSTSSHRAPDEPTDEQLDRLRNAIVAHAASSPDSVEIRRRTLERLDQSPFAALVMEDNVENPLTWCENHPGQTAKVRLTVSVEDSEGWANALAVYGYLKRIPDETMLARPADGEVGDGLEEVAQEIDDLDFDLTESIFELNLTGLPPGLRLATAEVQAMPTASLAFATGTGIWQKIAQRLRLTRPKITSSKSESESQVRTLHADSRDPAQPFLTVHSEDNLLNAKLKDNAELEVSVKASAWENRHPIVAEVMYESESGAASHRYILNDQPATRTADELIFRQQIRTPADAVDAEVTFSVRGMSTNEICLLPDSRRRNLFPEGAATCGLSLREIANNHWELTAFQYDIAAIQNGSAHTVLFRVEEQKGGVR